MKILVADPIADDGVAVLSRADHQVDVKTGLSPDELRSIVGDYVALVVRSETKVTADIIAAAPELQVVGRAGVGVDNIDLDAATARGIVVVNAPAGNIVTTAEHTLAMLFAIARNIPQAHASLIAGEWKRSQFVGTELRNKTLGIVGLGKVGSAIARRASALEMRILVHDPYVSTDVAERLDVELASLQDLLKQADFVTIHAPMTESTRSMIGADELALMKPTARLVNCARGGIVDENALYDAIESGRLAGAAVDVFTKEPAVGNILTTSDKIIVTPHLGASTAEAQVNVAVDVAEEILAVLRGEQARHAVNVAIVPPEALKELTPFIGVAVALGELGIQAVDGNLQKIRIEYAGDIAEHETSPLTASLIKGLLGSISEVPINLVNAKTMADERQLEIIEESGAASEAYNSLITVTVEGSEGSFAASGTVMQGTARIVSIDGYSVDITPNGSYWMLSRNRDQPGMIGIIGTVLGKADININTMQVGRVQPRGNVLMVLGLDEPIGDDEMEQILAIDGIFTAKVVKL